MSASTEINKSQLKPFAQLSSLEDDLRDEFLQLATLESFPPGRRIFNQNDQDNKTLFLLSGQMAIISSDGPNQIKAESEEASMPIADDQPRKVSAIASTRVVLLSIDCARYEDILIRHRENLDKPEIILGDELFNSPLIQNLPDANRYVFLQKLQTMPVVEGQRIISVGDEAAFYYLIKKGTARVSRPNKRTKEDTILGDLKCPNSFGERALIANLKHSANVIMLEDGILLRLSKGQFLTLIVRPFMQKLTFDEMVKMQNDGAVLVDIRSTTAFKRTSLEDSINIPLAILKNTSPIIDKNKHYIVVGDTGKRMSIAAFMLIQQGVEVWMLDTTIRELL